MRIVSKLLSAAHVYPTITRLVFYPVAPRFYFAVQREKSSWQAPPKEEDPFSAHINRYSKGAAEEIEELKSSICNENPSYEDIKRVSKILMSYEMKRKDEFREVVRQKRRQGFPKEDRIEYMDQYFSFVLSSIERERNLAEQIQGVKQDILELLDLTHEDIDQYYTALNEDPELLLIVEPPVQLQDVRNHLNLKISYAQTPRINDIMQAAQRSLTKANAEARPLFSDIMQVIYSDQVFENQPSLDSDRVLLAYDEFTEQIGPELEQFNKLTAHIVKRIIQIENAQEGE